MSLLPTELNEEGVPVVFSSRWPPEKKAAAAAAIAAADAQERQRRGIAQKVGTKPFAPGAAPDPSFKRSGDAPPPGDTDTLPSDSLPSGALRAFLASRQEPPRLTRDQILCLGALTLEDERSGPTPEEQISARVLPFLTAQPQGRTDLPLSDPNRTAEQKEARRDAILCRAFEDADALAQKSEDWTPPARRTRDQILCGED
jgi:hypothetical protein